MLNSIITEFQKLRRYSIILIGIIGVACSPIITITSQNIMTDDAKSILNYTFPDLMNSTIWNNMTIFFPMILALIGGYMMNREYSDDTLKNILVVPVLFPKMIISKLAALGVLSVLFGLFNSLITVIVGLIACRENMTVTTVLTGTIQITIMALFTCIGEMPLIAYCGRKRDAFKGGSIIAFLLGYISIYFKNPMIRNLYPLSAGLSIVNFEGEGFVSDTAGAYSASQNSLIGIVVIIAMLVLAIVIAYVPRKESKINSTIQKEGNRKKGRRKKR